MMPRAAVALLALSWAGCWVSHETAGDLECDEPMVAHCGLRDVWIFPSMACGLDHTAAIGLCPHGRAVFVTTPTDLGGPGMSAEGTWTTAVSPNLVAVDLPESELAFEWSEADDTLSWRHAPDGCTEPVGYRFDDARLDRPGWNADWARDVCDLTDTP